MSGSWILFGSRFFVMRTLTIASAALLIISGIYLAATGAGWSQGWIQISLVGALLIAARGALASRRVHAIGEIEAVPRESGVAVLGMFVSCRTAIALGVVMLMTIKPGLTESIAIIAIAVAGGLVCGTAIRTVHLAMPECETDAEWSGKAQLPIEPDCTKGKGAL